jgi:hypothetical protein
MLLASAAETSETYRIYYSFVFFDYPLLLFSCSEILFSHIDCFLVFRNGKTPLHRSASEGQLETCRLLLQSNAYVDSKEK